MRCANARPSTPVGMPRDRLLHLKVSTYASPIHNWALRGNQRRVWRLSYLSTTRTLKAPGTQAAATAICGTGRHPVQKRSATAMLER